MRNLLLLTTMLFPLPGLAATIDAVSMIDHVIVYPDGATITRHVSADLPAGAHTLILHGLPAGIDPNSIRVEGKADDALAIASVDSRIAPGDANPTPNPALQTRLDGLREERIALAGAIEAAELQKAAVQRFAQASPEKLSNNAASLEPEKWPLIWQTIGRGLAEVNITLIGLRAHSKELDQQIAVLESARPPSGQPGAPRRDVLIAFEAGAALKADLTVSYQVQSASWAALYDARLNTSGAKPQLDLVRRASVQQHTGEDWNGITLSLSTVRLRRGTAAPDLQTLSLNLYDLQAESEARFDAARPRASVARPAPLAAEPPAGKALALATPILAAVDAGGFETSFNVPGKVEIPQDGVIKSFTLIANRIEPTLAARVTPALDTTAYLEAAFDNQEEAPLLPGEVALHRDGTFVGKGQLSLVASGDRVRLGFGSDDQIKVTRNPVAKRDNDGGFFGSSRSEIQDTRMAVKNLHKFPIRIGLIDRIPISENASVTVDPLSTNTPATDKNVEDKRGVMGWTYDYAPGERREVRLGWRIKWPADRQLSRR